ncbi:hypothetical protein [Kitasatospora sp. NPDC097691]|uniref:hypothetical protein n=1 Tax=Kitasatospora sp. NPDC097691 TaxID=3157231 RepID=UPI003330027E
MASRGLVAAALQYAHAHTKVTLSYAGRSGTTWMDDIHIETLEMVLEQNEQDARLLDEGEHVSGPSADGYRRRVRARPLRRTRGHRRKERGAAPRPGEPEHPPRRRHDLRMATRDRGLLQARLEAGLSAEDGPDESECRSACTNLAYTDRSIVEQRLRLKRWEATAADRPALRPLRDRAAALAAGSRVIIDAHERTTANNQTREH